MFEESLIESQTQSVRKCSFCRCAGHTIKTCNDERITCFEALCQLKKWEYNLEHNPRQRFALWLVTFAVEYRTTHVVKAFAVRKCKAVTRNYFYDCVDKIIYYFYGMQPVYENDKYKINMMYDTKLDSSEVLCECSICYDDKIGKEFVTLNCNHTFCGACVVGIIKNNNHVIVPSCALCREPINAIKYTDTNFVNKMIEYVDM
jgi:hypothetical protein